MAFRHGVYTSELPTSILPARSVASNVVFAVGTAAVDRLAADKPRYVNRLRMYYSYDEFVSEMGWDEENFNKYRSLRTATSRSTGARRWWCATSSIPPSTKRASAARP